MLKLLSLFSGCGGMDLGFTGDFTILSKSVNATIHPNWIVEQIGSFVKLKRTNFETIFANDIKEEALMSWAPYFYRYHFTKDNNIFKFGSIIDMVKQHKTTQYNIFPNNVDIVTGGFPCQDFSVSGLRKGFKSHKSHKNELHNDSDNPTLENRGMLYMWMREVVEITNPKMFIAENVKGLISLSDAKHIIEQDFASIGGDGYLVVPAQVLRAVDYGVPQSRERVIFFGFRKSALKKKALEALQKNIIPSSFDPYPPPTHYFPHIKNKSISSDLCPFVTVKDALEGLPEPDESTDLSHQKYSKAKWYGRHCQGQTEVNLNGIGPTIRSEHHGNIEFRRLSAENGGKNLNELQHGLSERRLTVRECARIQTFPDDFEFVRKSENGKKYELSVSAGYKLVGNAVPPLLAYNIAMRIQSLWGKYFRKQ